MADRRRMRRRIGGATNTTETFRKHTQHTQQLRGKKPGVRALGTRGLWVVGRGSRAETTVSKFNSDRLESFARGAWQVELGLVAQSNLSGLGKHGCSNAVGRVEMGRGRECKDVERESGKRRKEAIDL